MFFYEAFLQHNGQIYDALLLSLLFPLFHGSVASHGRRGEVFSRCSLVATLSISAAFPFMHPALLFSPFLNNSLSSSLEKKTASAHKRGLYNWLISLWEKSINCRRKWSGLEKIERRNDTETTGEWGEKWWNAKRLAFVCAQCACKTIINHLWLDWSTFSGKRRDVIEQNCCISIDKNN